VLELALLLGWPVLPGAAVTLSGAFGTQTTTTDSNGEFRFLRVDHGTHTVPATLSGFAGVSREVVINVGRNVTLDFSMKVASVASFTRSPAAGAAARLSSFICIPRYQGTWSQT